MKGLEPEWDVFPPLALPIHGVRLKRRTVSLGHLTVAALGVHTSLIYLDASISRWNDAAAVQKHIDYLRERLEEVSWNGHQFGAICTSLPAMVRHVDRALATVMLDQVANAV